MLAINISPAAAARGQNHEDMFYDMGYIYDRPAVPSDSLRGAEVFPNKPLFFNKNAEMFSRANKINFMMHDELVRPVRMAQVPIHLLHIDN